MYGCKNCLISKGDGPDHVIVGNVQGIIQSDSNAIRITKLSIQRRNTFVGPVIVIRIIRSKISYPPSYRCDALIQKDGTDHIIPCVSYV